MKILGKNIVVNSNTGAINTTLHLSDSFDSYYSNESAGRFCEGVRVMTLFVGSYDCKNLPVGAEVEIYFDKMVTTAKGSFQKVKKSN